jgi:hypothetical protein
MPINSPPLDPPDGSHGFALVESLENDIAAATGLVDELAEVSGLLDSDPLITDPEPPPSDE